MRYVRGIMKITRCHKVGNNQVRTGLAAESSDNNYNGFGMKRNDKIAAGEEAPEK